MARLAQLTFAISSTGRRSLLARSHAQNSAISRASMRIKTSLLPIQQARTGFFASGDDKPKSKTRVPRSLSAVLLGPLLLFSLNPTADILQAFDSTDKTAKTDRSSNTELPPQELESHGKIDDHGTWSKLVDGFEGFSAVTSAEAGKLSNKLVDLVLPEWSKLIPGYIRKLQRELNMAPGSLAAEIWEEARDPAVNPEVQYSAKVRVSEDLCDEEKTFLARRKKITAVALAHYLGVKEEDINPEDVPTIAICGSGGGLRALVAGTGSYMAAAEDGLFDIVTYTSGVSGSCWLQALYFSSLSGGDFQRTINHLKARLGIHIAYPPTAFSSILSAPTNKLLLTAMVEKLKGDPEADFGLVDAYGMLLAARLFIPRGELGVNAKDFKLSNQQEYIRYGQNPMPIYTAVRHEIPELDDAGGNEQSHASETAKAQAKKEAWFQWFEMTPFELFCEEFAAGIPTWAMGRRFQNGVNLPTTEGFYLPEIRLPVLLGIWGSAFCATLSHYYREIRPLIQSLGGFQAVDNLIWGHNEDLSKVHPIDPATIPNFIHGMNGKLPRTVPRLAYDLDYIQLMDSGMSNNLPIYPLLRPGRNVDVIVAFDASADIKTDNWLSVVEGYAKQRGIKGWPIGAGWPRPSASASTTAEELKEAEESTEAEADNKLAEAKADQARRHADDPNVKPEGGSDKSLMSQQEKYDQTANELGYCTVWVGTTQERRTDTPPPPPVDDSSSWKLMEPDAGIAVVYMPFLANEKVPGSVDPASSGYMSTWNFVYTPEQVDQVVALARANYDEGKEKIRATVRAVYERKKKRRQEMEQSMAEERQKRRVKLGIERTLAEGDHFS
ncbi:acyl transferase/acyl hydrolase/lysophospholipase [Pseudoneurospora amorphoporcata]|uniref:Lysophospholipase n=1 Tax=Pseudoneurospora amorphoporcata TaxID=241081 RepID=A0AAN6P0X7_9PEZI|nr:acyl transferase/acyl hydrolase/lysophospholipase [Pseudoneurospora amorphoporcata]